MLLLSFNIGPEFYAIETQIILEVIPLIPIDHVPHVESSICGIIHYRGRTVPVVDLSIYFKQKPSKQRLSSRIIVCRFTFEQQSFHVGLIAEHVTETLQCNENELEDNGITDSASHFLGKICRHQKRSIQIINTENLLPEPVQQQLLATQ